MAVSWKDAKSEEPLALAVGNFDGVHAGHQALIKKALEFAKRLGIAAGVVTFHPHPMKFFNRAGNIILTPTEEKLRLIRLYGINRIFLLKFDESLSCMGPEEFVAKVLVERLQCKALVVGENFRFGKDRSGDVSLLKKLSSRYNFEFFAYPAVIEEGIPVSSTRIRRLIREGNIKLAWKLLRRPYRIIGKVVKGEGRGKMLGFPTANIEPYNEIVPKNGVYTAFADLGDRLMKAVVNIGTKPTFGNEEVTVEAHIIDLDEDLYGKEIALYFVDRLRDEKKFGSVDELIEAITRDVGFARESLQWESFFVGLD